MLGTFYERLLSFTNVPLCNRLYGCFPFDSFEIPGIPCDKWNSIFRFVGPWTRQHNSLLSFPSKPDTNRLQFMFSKLFWIPFPFNFITIFYLKIWMVMYVFPSQLKRERKGRDTGDPKNTGTICYAWKYCKKKPQEPKAYFDFFCLF